MPGSYGTELVLLSIIVAMMASYTALDLAGRVTYSKGRAAHAWLVGGAFAMGAGIWSMHFIGMLAFSLPIRLAYDLKITAMSMVIAIVTSGFALAQVGRENLSTSRLLTGGVIMGAGICGMHYTGMAAMRMMPPIRYDPLLFSASVLIAVAASVAALWLAFTLRSGTSGRTILARILAAMVMGFAITGMHYTGMAAANFDPRSICTATDVLNLANVQLGILIAIVMLSILSTTLMASFFDTRLASNNARMLASLEKANAELEAEIARRQAMERQLEAAVENLYRSNEELEQFAYVASHDLQAPLRAIVTFSQMLGEECKGRISNEADEFLDFIVDGGKRMQTLILDLLQLSRIGKDNAPPEAVPVEEAVERARKQLRADIVEKGVKLEVGAMPEVMGNAAQLTQLFQNLIGNAIKYTAQGVTPEVTISAKREGDKWHFLVEDNGIGIPREHLRAIFIIFRRLHLNEQYPGTGIGLSLCKKIVVRHDGDIWVESALGKGSRFHFTLTAVDAEHPMTTWPHVGPTEGHAA